jgi:DNA repair exonuclease SbcCD nuclease subunit
MSSQGELEKFDFGRAQLLSAKPWSLLPLSEEAELLAIPFQKDYSGYREWKVPPKKKPMRILLAHGVVPGFAYMGSGEDSDSVLDEELFAYFEIDLAALGHLHGNYVIRKGETLIAYPGSARVWREGEVGPRKVLAGTTEAIPPVLEPKILRSAGEYRVIPVYVSPGGELRIEKPEKISGADYLRLEVSGVVEDEPSVRKELEKIENELKTKCRELTINTDKLSVLAGVSTHPLAKSFLRGWEEAAARYAGEEAGVYEMARLKGLGVLKEIIGNRK